MAEYDKDEPNTDKVDSVTPRGKGVPDEDRKILQEILDDYDYDVTNWEPIKTEAAIDVAYAANDGWNDADKAVRKGRPMLNLDQLSQYRNQVENTVRQNKRGVKLSPAGGGASDKTAEMRANRIREIEYQSHAQEAYSQAFSDCLTRGFGFARIVAEYEDEDSDNQVIRIKAIPNPSQVLPDTDAQSTSGRDWMRCTFLDSLSHAQFKRDYPTATIRDFDPDLVATAPKGWLTSTRVQIAECWRVRETPNPRGKGKPIREVCMYLTNGLELLAKPGQPKKHTWKGKYIPFAACLGRVVYRDGTAGATEKLILSYIRFARDAAKGYNWTKSTILEKIALPVKASLMGYEGQADKDTLELIERSTQEHVAWIGFKPVLDQTGNQVLPLPQYGTREPDIQADVLVAEGFARDIQNALGHFNASDGRLGQTKVVSGVALQEQKRAGDLGSYDFQDHYDDFIKFVGEQADDLLTHYDDAEKEVATRLPDNTVQMVKINTPTKKAPNGEPTFGPEDIRMDQGRHTVTISTGPSFDSQREAGKDAAMTLLGNPQAFPIVAADAIRLMDLGPIGDQMAEDLEFLQPPVMQQARAQKKQNGGEPDPRMLQQELAATKGQLQQLEGIAKEMNDELKGKKAEMESKERIEDKKLAFEREKLDKEIAAKLSIAETQARTKGVQSAHEAEHEAVAMGHEAEQAEHDRAHEVGITAMAAAEAAKARQHQAAMQAAGVGAEAEMQRTGHEQNLEAAAQAAALAPPPASDNGASA